MRRMRPLLPILLLATVAAAETPTVDQAAADALAALAADEPAALRILAERNDPDPWLVVAALCAQEKFDALGKKPEEDAEAAFYSGKVMSARFFVNNLLPRAYSNIEGIMSGDRSALEIAEEAF